MVDKPSLVMPDNIPHFEGFEFESDLQASEDSVVNFLLVRGIRFPSFIYNNNTQSLDLREGSLSKAIDHYSDRFARKEDVHTGLVVGPEDCWQLSIIIFICHVVARSAGSDIQKILDDFERRRRLS